MNHRRMVTADARGSEDDTVVCLANFSVGGALPTDRLRFVAFLSSSPAIEAAIPATTTHEAGICSINGDYCEHWPNFVVGRPLQS